MSARFPKSDVVRPLMNGEGVFVERRNMNYDVSVEIIVYIM